MYTKDNWAATITAMHSGEVIEVDSEVFDYFLGVLPPVYMNRRMDIGGQSRMVMFGFAEGTEPITAFWFTHSDGHPIRYWAQRTKEMNRG